MRQVDPAIPLRGSSRGVPRGITRKRPSPLCLGVVRALRFPLVCILLLLVSIPTVWADSGSLSGTVKDPTGAVIAGATVTTRNMDTGVQQTVKTNESGVYNFPSLPVGHYTLESSFEGFRPYKRTDLLVDVNSVLGVDVTLEMGEHSEQMTVTGSGLHVETSSSEVGGIVYSSEITSVALNGRSYTDLLQLQPGIVPMTTQQPDSIVMAGAQVAIAPSGGLNPGNQSISGQREDANGFVVNGGDVKEMMNGGTSIVPNLDSIDEFQILTNNFDAEYGNYSGGIVHVVTKSGTNQLHGTAFEFLRNTDLDGKDFFSPQRAQFNQNQFGGTAGGPLKKNKAFFFADYQGTRKVDGIDTGLIPVPSFADQTGNLSDQASAFTTITTIPGTQQQVIVPTAVSGGNLATLLSNKLGSTVSAQEPYYFTAGEHRADNPSQTYSADCTSSAQCVFPNVIIPQQVWSDPARNLRQYIPLPNFGSSSFSTAAQTEKLRDDKLGYRVDGNSARWGLLSAYYYFDDYRLDNPYPTGQGGASVPGFNAVTLGRAQLINLGDTKTFGPSTVNEFHLSYMRNANNVGQPVGGVGPTLASQGFVTGPGTPGIVPLDPSIEGIENVIFNSFVIGTPITNLQQWNNTFSLADNFSKVAGNHTLRTGLDVSFEQVNVHPNPTFNGSFAFFGSETGSDFADFLIGVASNYNQADSMSYYGRHKYASGFVQDSWRARPSLTLNYGLRLELMQYWSEKYNQIPALVLGQQSKVYPTAPPGIVYPSDPGIPNTLVPQRVRFAPRFGLAYSPKKKPGLLGRILGGQGKASIRAGYGIFNSVIQGNTIAFDQPQPPYGLSYTSPGPPLFATPFISAADGSVHVNPFPLTFPPLNASASHPNPNIDFSPFIPIAGMTAPYRGNTYPYSENYFLSLERQLSDNVMMSVSYVGNQAHHLLLVYSANPGNPALCLSLSQPSAVASGSPTCGPFGEDTTYTNAAGQTVKGTRAPFGSNFHNDDYEASVGNSNYNSLQASLRRSGKTLNLSIAYTFSKSIDQASSLADPVNPYNFNATRSLSAWDLRHSLVGTYEYQLPVAHLVRRANIFTEGWSLTGITRVSTGFPVTLSSDGDRSLQGSIPNGVNNHSLDLPDFAPGPLDLNHNPRNALPYFNLALFSPNALGTPGNSPRRFFSGPGMFNTDLALVKSFPLGESKTLQFRLETFNTFNHTQFFGPGAVNGDISSALFGHVVKAASPRLMQAALKFAF